MCLYGASLPAYIYILFFQLLLFFLQKFVKNSGMAIRNAKRAKEGEPEKPI